MVICNDRSFHLLVIFVVLSFRSVCALCHRWVWTHRTGTIRTLRLWCNMAIPAILLWILFWLISGFQQQLDFISETYFRWNVYDFVVSNKQRKSSAIRNKSSILMIDLLDGWILTTYWKAARWITVAIQPEFHVLYEESKLNESNTSILKFKLNSKHFESWTYLNTMFSLTRASHFMCQNVMHLKYITVERVTN